jgi:hypothetical protein
MVVVGSLSRQIAHAPPIDRGGGGIAAEPSIRADSVS